MPQHLLWAEGVIFGHSEQNSDLNWRQNPGPEVDKVYGRLAKSAPGVYKVATAAPPGGAPK